MLYLSSTLPVENLVEEKDYAEFLELRGSGHNRPVGDRLRVPKHPGDRQRVAVRSHLHAEREVVGVEIPLLCLSFAGRAEHGFEGQEDEEIRGQGPTEARGERRRQRDARFNVRDQGLERQGVRGHDDLPQGRRHRPVLRLRVFQWLLQSAGISRSLDHSEPRFRI